MYDQFVEELKENEPIQPKNRHFVLQLHQLRDLHIRFRRPLHLCGHVRSGA